MPTCTSTPRSCWSGGTAGRLCRIASCRAQAAFRQFPRRSILPIFQPALSISRSIFAAICAGCVPPSCRAAKDCITSIWSVCSSRRCKRQWPNDGFAGARYAAALSRRGAHAPASQPRLSGAAFRLDRREILYVMTFCLPRFLDQPFEEKLVTLFHELFHIGPAFDGDLRRYAGRYEVHTHSQKEYDGAMGSGTAPTSAAGPTRHCTPSCG